MCLTVSNKLEIKIAEEDIVCYKVVCMYKNDFITPFRHMKIVLNKEYSEPDFNSYVCSVNKNDICYEFHGNMYHTFKNKNESIEFRNIIDSIEKDTEVKPQIIESIIPKGSKYIEGIFVFNFNEYGLRKYIYMSSFGSEKIIYKTLN